MTATATCGTRLTCCMIRSCCSSFPHHRFRLSKQYPNIQRVIDFRGVIKEEPIHQCDPNILAFRLPCLVDLLESSPPAFEHLLVDRYTLLRVHVVMTVMAVGEMSCSLDVFQLLRHLGPNDGSRSVVPVRHTVCWIQRDLFFGL